MCTRKSRKRCASETAQMKAGNHNTPVKRKSTSFSKPDDDDARSTRTTTTVTTTRTAATASTVSTVSFNQPTKDTRPSSVKVIMDQIIDFTHKHMLDGVLLFLLFGLAVQYGAVIGGYGCDREIFDNVVEKLWRGSLACMAVVVYVCLADVFHYRQTQNIPSWVAIIVTGCICVFLNYQRCIGQRPHSFCSPGQSAMSVDAVMPIFAYDILWFISIDLLQDIIKNRERTI